MKSYKQELNYIDAKLKHTEMSNSIQTFINTIYPYRNKAHILQSGQRFSNYLHEYTSGYTTDITEILDSAIYDYIFCLCAFKPNECYVLRLD